MSGVEHRIGGGVAPGSPAPVAGDAPHVNPSNTTGGSNVTGTSSQESEDRCGQSEVRRPYQTNPPQAAEAPSVQQMMESCQGMVRTVAWTIHQRLPPHVELEDLIAYGHLGLAQAAETFRPERGKFATYAFYRVRGAILDGLSKMSWFSRHEYHARRYEQMSHEVLAIDDGSKKASTMKDDSLENNARWLRNVTGSLSVIYLATGIEESSATQMCDNRAAQPDQLAVERELRQRLCTLVDHLPSDAGDLIRMTYLEGLSLTEAASRLGVSRSWACRLHARTLNRLARAMDRLCTAEVNG